MKRLITISGPTASSKTRIAIEVAKRYNGEIINSDSRQFFKYMEIGTASPDKKERSEAVHHLYNILNPDEPINAGLFMRMADQKIEEVTKRGKTPIIVGGTGLYLKTLLMGIARIPEIPHYVREEVKNRLEKEGVERCYEILRERDPEYASIISPSDRQRIERALEVIFFTNKKFSSFHSNHRFSERRYESVDIIIIPERRLLYKRINERTNNIFKNGIIEETETLIKLGYHNTSAFKAIGYQEAYKVITSQIDIDRAVELTALRTRHYAKRQITWFKKMEGKVFDNPDDLEKIFAYLDLCLR